MSNLTLTIALAFSGLGGFVLGIFYFYSLWITVRQLPVTVYPIRLTIGSLLGRLAVTLLGFYLIMDGVWYRGLAALIGFIIGRIAVTHRKGKLHLKNTKF